MNSTKSKPKPAGKQVSGTVTEKKLIRAPQTESKISKIPLSELLPRSIKAEEKKEERDEFIAVKLLADSDVLVGAGAKALLRASNMRWTGVLTGGGSLATSSNGSYAVVFGWASGDLFVHTVTASNEYSNLTALFDEVFIHEMEIHYHPRNVSGGGVVQTTATASNAIQSVGFSLVALQHDGAAYSDASSGWYNCLENPTGRYFRTDRSVSFRWRNVDKFSWDGVLMDATTSARAQTWMPVGAVAAKYGGRIQGLLDTAAVTGGGVTGFPPNQTIGMAAIKWRVSLRVRS